MLFRVGASVDERLCAKLAEGGSQLVDVEAIEVRMGNVGLAVGFIAAGVHDEHLVFTPDEGFRRQRPR